MKPSFGKTQGVFPNSFSALPKNSTLPKWEKHYRSQLKHLYYLFEKKCINLNLDFHKYIDYQSFTQFIFDNSSKYMTPWI